MIRYTAALAIPLILPGLLLAGEAPVRVGGDREVMAVFNAETSVWSSGPSRITTALPEGYPAPTPPGAIEIKQYPLVRRAEITVPAGQSGFWPLFRHIERERIAMTSPVEMDYAQDRPNEWTMSFLYRRLEMGQVGQDPADDRVTVRDVEPVTVVAFGGRGSYDAGRIKRDLEVLHNWLANQEEWVQDGSPRALLYNGPNMRPANNWLEVQIPIRPATVRTESKSSSPREEMLAQADMTPTETSAPDQAE